MIRSRRVSTSKARLEVRAVLEQFERRVVLADVVGERVRLLVALAGDLGVEREQVVGLSEFLRFEDSSSGFVPRCSASLGDRRRAPERDGQLLDRAVDAEVEFLQAARHLDRPAFVAEVALDLADDRRRRVGRELDAALEVEAVDRLEQPDACRLGSRSSSASPRFDELDREKAHEVEVRDDQLVAQRVVLARIVALCLRRGPRARARIARTPRACAGGRGGLRSEWVPSRRRGDALDHLDDRDSVLACVAARRPSPIRR